MIKVEILKNQGNEITAFRVEGHAGWAEEGQDIVCAGVSAVVQAALLGLLKHLGKKPIYKVEKGSMAVVLPQDMGPEDRFKASIILETMEEALGNICESYHGWVELKTRRC